MEPLSLSLTPALLSCTKRSVKLQEQLFPFWSDPESPSLVPVPVLRRFLLTIAPAGWLRAWLEPTHTF